MNKDELIKLICAAVLKEPIITKADMEKSSICGRSSTYKNGLYFLYDKNGELIYIGKVGNTAGTSLYDRMVGHSTGCHKIIDARWYPLVEYGKFHCFSGLTAKELDIVERLAISGMNHPVYNDGIDVIHTVVNSLFPKI